MKLLYPVSVLALVFLFASCSSDDDGPALNAEDVLPGTWEVVEADSEFDAVVPGLITTTTISEGTEFEGDVTFSEDPNVWESNLGGTFDLTIIINFGGQTDSEEDTEVLPQEERSGTWSINEEGQLEGFFFDIPADEDIDLEEFNKYDVQVVNNNRIVLTNNVELTETDPSTGFEFTITGSSRTVMVRQ